MAKRVPISFSGITFKNQVAAKDYFRNILLKLESQGAIDENDVHWSIFNEVVTRHSEYSEKRGSGIKQFLIVRSAYNNIEMQILRNDETIIDISWVKCITGKASTVLENLKSAMRSRIDSEVKSFKDNHYSDMEMCQLCMSRLVSYEDTHVDHIVHFETLVDQFLELNPMHPELFDDEVGTNRACFKQVDVAYSDSWFNYHSLNATLRLTHEGCNLRRPKASKVVST